MKHNIFKNSFYYENLFYLTCSTNRLSKLVAQFIVFEKSKSAKGTYAEFGVFKGSSLFRFLIFREMLKDKRLFYAFDSFGKFRIPKNIDKDELNELKLFFKEAGNDSISKKNLQLILKKRGLDKNIKLIQGDILQSLKLFLKKNKKIKFSFLNLDVDLYGISKFILENIWKKVSKKGIIWFDDYEGFPGAKRAINEFLIKNHNASLQKLSFDRDYYYCIKK